MNTRTSPKTPYEIRLELLQLATNVLLEKHKAMACAAHNIIEGRVNPTTSPTTEEIVEEAEKMNVFISMANQHNR